MLKEWVFLSAVFAASIVPMGPALSEDSIRLRYAPLRADLPFEFTVESLIRQEVAGCQIERRERITLSGDFRPVERAGFDSWKVQAELTGIKCDVTTPFENMKLDSDLSDDGANFLSTRYLPFVGESFDMPMLPDGPDRSQPFTAEAQEDEWAFDLGEMDEDDYAMMEMLLFGLSMPGETIGDPLADVVLALFPSYPAGSMRDETSWRADLLITNGAIPLSCSATYRIDHADERVYYLSVEGSSASQKEERMEFDDLEIGCSLDASGSMRGEVEVSRANGWPERGVYEFELTGKAVRLGLEIPVSIAITIDYRLGG